MANTPKPGEPTSASPGTDPSTSAPPADAPASFPEAAPAADAPDPAPAEAVDAAQSPAPSPPLERVEFDDSPTLVKAVSPGVSFEDATTLVPTSAPATAADSSSEDAGDEDDADVDEHAKTRIFQPGEVKAMMDEAGLDPDSAADEADEADPEPAPPTTFDALELPDAVRSAVAAMGWDVPTAVQAMTFPLVAAGRDILVQSQTGSGKTGAFCLPWLAQRFEPGNAAETGVQLLVLTPTRELAKQVCDQLQQMAKDTDVRTLPIYGGTAMQPQLQALREGIHAVVGTPGRILDHIRRRSLKLDRVRMAVLDEADEMLSMGFLEDIHAILDACATERQTCLFSATVPPDIERIARRYMRDPESVLLSGDQVAAAEIKHAYYQVSGAIKVRDMIDMIAIEEPANALVFCNTREETYVVASALRREGYQAEPLSSDLTQAARERVMGRMRSGQLRFLVATDVASRGIDISHIGHVINYSFPENAESYVHRTGRTGRAGRPGVAISLISPQELGNHYYLKLQYPSIEFEERSLPPAEELAKQRVQNRLDQVSRMFPELVAPEWTLLARNLASDPRGEQVMAFLLKEAITHVTKEREKDGDYGVDLRRSRDGDRRPRGRGRRDREWDDRDGDDRRGDRPERGRWERDDERSDRGRSDRGRSDRGRSDRGRRGRRRDGDDRRDGFEDGARRRWRDGDDRRDADGHRDGSEDGARRRRHDGDDRRDADGHRDGPEDGARRRRRDGDDHRDADARRDGLEDGARRRRRRDPSADADADAPRDDHGRPREDDDSTATAEGRQRSRRRARRRDDALDDDAAADVSRDRSEEAEHALPPARSREELSDAPADALADAPAEGERRRRRSRRGRTRRDEQRPHDDARGAEARRLRDSELEPGPAADEPRDASFGEADDASDDREAETRAPATGELEAEAHGEIVVDAPSPEPPADASVDEPAARARPEDDDGGEGTGRRRRRRRRRRGRGESDADARSDARSDAEPDEAQGLDEPAASPGADTTAPLPAAAIAEDSLGATTEWVTDDGPSDVDAQTLETADGAETISDPGTITGVSGRRRRRRRRRRGRGRPEDEAATTGESDGSGDATAQSAAADQDDDAELDADSGDKRRRRRRRGGRRRGRSGEDSTDPTSNSGRPHVSQDQIVIDIDETELEVVRDQFGEIDELDDLTLKGRRRGVMDALQDEVELEDLSELDADEPEADAEGDDDADEPEADAEEDVDDDAPPADGDADTSEASPDASSADAEGEPAEDPRDAKKRKRRRRRRKKKVPPPPPELTAPPHKDFWEVWAQKFTYQDFEDDAYLGGTAAVPDEPEPEPAPEPPSMPDTEDEDTFVRVRLNVGRKHGKKAAHIRELLAESFGLARKAVRDLTVGEASSRFRLGPKALAKLEEVIVGFVFDGIELTVTRIEPKPKSKPKPTEREPDVAESEPAGSEPGLAAESATSEPDLATEPATSGRATDPAEFAEPATSGQTTEPAEPAEPATSGQTTGPAAVEAPAEASTAEAPSDDAEDRASEPASDDDAEGDPTGSNEIEPAP